MLRSKIYIILGCLLASFFFACSEQEEERQVEKTYEEETQVSAINPNGDSELALLMRNLSYETDSLKQLIMNDKGNVSDEFIAELERVHTASPTDPTVKTAEFKAFNELLVNQAKALQEATDAETKTEQFNQLVNRCIDCHKVVCPGPIKRIKKLVIK